MITSVRTRKFIELLLALVGIYLATSYFQPIKIALNTYEVELGFENSSPSARGVTASPEDARAQIRPYYQPLAGFALTCFGFYLLVTSANMHDDEKFELSREAGNNS